ncbi:sugar ABC transporter permease, partial [Kitasatospora sp. NPDC057015]
MLTVTAAPIVFLIYTSFTDYNQRSLFTGSYHLVGLRQYSVLLDDPQFWRALLRSVLFTAAMVA